MEIIDENENKTRNMNGEGKLKNLKPLVDHSLFPFLYSVDPTFNIFFKKKLSKKEILNEVMNSFEDFEILLAGKLTRILKKIIDKEKAKPDQILKLEKFVEDFSKSMINHFHNEFGNLLKGEFEKVEIFKNWFEKKKNSSLNETSIFLSSSGMEHEKYHPLPSAHQMDSVEQDDTPQSMDIGIRSSQRLSGMEHEENHPLPSAHQMDSFEQIDTPQSIGNEIPMPSEDNEVISNGVFQPQNSDEEDDSENERNNNSLENQNDIEQNSRELLSTTDQNDSNPNRMGETLNHVRAAQNEIFSSKKEEFDNLFTPENLTTESQTTESQNIHETLDKINISMMSKKTQPGQAYSSNREIKIEFNSRKRFIDKSTDYFYRMKAYKSTIDFVESDWYVQGGAGSTELFIGFKANQSKFSETPSTYLLSFDLERDMLHLDNFEMKTNQKNIFKTKSEGKGEELKLQGIDCVKVLGFDPSKKSLEVLVYDHKSKIVLKFSMKCQFIRIRDFFRRKNKDVDMIKIKNMKVYYEKNSCQVLYKGKIDSDSEKEVKKERGRDILIFKTIFALRNFENEEIEFYQIEDTSTEKTKLYAKFVFKINPVQDGDEIVRLVNFEKFSKFNQTYIACAYENGTVRVHKLTDNKRDSSHNLCITINLKQKLITASNEEKENFIDLEDNENWEYKEVSYSAKVNETEYKNIPTEQLSDLILKGDDLTGIEEKINSMRKKDKCREKDFNEVIGSLSATHNDDFLALTTKMKGSDRLIRIVLIKLKILNNGGIGCPDFFEQFFYTKKDNKVQISCGLGDVLGRCRNTIYGTNLVEVESAEAGLNTKLMLSLLTKGKFEKERIVNFSCLDLTVKETGQDKMSYKASVVNSKTQKAYHEVDCNGGFVQKMQFNKNKKIVLHSIGEKGMLNEAIYSFR